MSDTDPSTIPFGLIELDATGTILYYKPEKQSLTGTLSSTIIGRNFSPDIIAIAEARELSESSDYSPS
jgi:PAS domain-containing protein